MRASTHGRIPVGIMYHPGFTYDLAARSADMLHRLDHAHQRDVTAGSGAEQTKPIIDSDYLENSP